MASQADKITATNRAARIGSIGVAAEFRVREDSVTLTSTQAPRKRPDVSTSEGRAMVVEELDAMHEIFVDAIASGRGMTPAEVNASFGQGATYLADKALKRGMIDAVGATALRVVANTNTPTARNSGKQVEATKMDLIELKAKHPEVYAAAMQAGVSGERDRVVAHLNMGAQAGVMDIAVTAIKDGSAMTMTLQSEYLVAAMSKRDTDNRAADDGDAAAAANGASASIKDDDQTRDAKAEKGIWAFALDRCGVEAEGVHHA
jgi:ClpP class serine protease